MNNFYNELVVVLVIRINYTSHLLTECRSFAINALNPVSLFSRDADLCASAKFLYLVYSGILIT